MAFRLRTIYKDKALAAKRSRFVCFQLMVLLISFCDGVQIKLGGRGILANKPHIGQIFPLLYYILKEKC